MLSTCTSRDGTRIAVERGGSGPALVLVHGTTATRQRWAPVLAPLQRQFTVHAMDRRGRGGSGDAEPHALQREAEDVAAVVEAAGTPVDLVGHSFGAICALEAALLAPVRRLVLYEPPLPTPGTEAFPPPALQRLQAMLEAGDREGMLALFFREINGMPPAQFEQFRQSPAWPARLALAHTLPRELRAVQSYRFGPARFAGLDVPVLLLLGGESPPYFADAIRMLAAALPDARQRMLPGQRHVAMDTAPDLFAGEVLSFLAA